MSRSKIAITVPQEIVTAVDRAARERRESRSAFISHVLREALRARRDAEITRRLDELFRNEAVAAEQRRTARELDVAGTDWSGEAW
jgi:metal-responsive CopG/Arc/MetJ family transcriptional regulator